MGNVRSVLGLLLKGQEFIKGIRSSPTSPVLLKMVLKDWLDRFDEGWLWARGNTTSAAGGETAVSEPPGHVSIQDDVSVSSEESDFTRRPDSHDDGTVITRRTLDVTARQQKRIARLRSSIGKSELPFSRSAFKASNINRFRLEAEARRDHTLSPFFDDDATIATAITRQTSPAARQSGRPDRVPKDRKQRAVPSEESSENSIVRNPSKGQDGSCNPSASSDFGQRVKTVAQVMLSPCVGPPFSKEVVPMTYRVPATEQKADHSIAQTQSSNTGQGWEEGSDDEGLPTIDEEKESAPQNMDGPSFLFSVSNHDGRAFPMAGGKYLYETVVAMWLRSTLDFLERDIAETIDLSFVSRYPFSTFPVPRHGSRGSSREAIFDFYNCMDFLLPLCLKSIAFRYCVEIAPVYPSETRVWWDECHLSLMTAFVEVLAKGVFGQALCGSEESDKGQSALLRALKSAECVVDFIVGIASIIHTEHLRNLCSRLFGSLRACEMSHPSPILKDATFQWSKESLYRAKCSRQIRLRFIEEFSTLPSCVALNYPRKFVERTFHANGKKSSWTKQSEGFDFECASRPPSVERLPPGGWLSVLLVEEGLSICAMSCEAVVAEAMAHIHASERESPRSKPNELHVPKVCLAREDLMTLQSIAIHGISCVYELLVRRHTMDRRFQSVSALKRLAGMICESVLDKSVDGSRWIARMESNHRVRTVWLLCLLFVLQEAPQAVIREHIRVMCDPNHIRIHRFIRLLRLCSSSFQNFASSSTELEFMSGQVATSIEQNQAPWLLQESFNTICATINLVVEESVLPLSSHPHEQSKVIVATLELLLHVLTTPQSPVTHLRAIGGAIQALEQFGVDIFLETTGSHLQHWVRVVIGLMNSPSLSVRSIAVDFVVSLLGSCFRATGDVDEIMLVFATVLPEVAAREIGLYSVGGNVFSINDAAATLWPLRRSLADLDDTKPNDDNRVDAQLSQLMSTFCRACQAIIDGVIIEITLRKESKIVGASLTGETEAGSIFDADEESLYEAAEFFSPESSPMQRLRWLLVLVRLHEGKDHWVEAGETLFLCGTTIVGALPYLSSVWRPSRFALWSDNRRSHWLDAVGEDLGVPERGNPQVMEFASKFLEPYMMAGVDLKVSSTGKLHQPSAAIFCDLFTSVAQRASAYYFKEKGSDTLAYHRLSILAGAMSDMMKVYKKRMLQKETSLTTSDSLERHRYVAETAAMDRAMAGINPILSGIAKRIDDTLSGEYVSGYEATSTSCYVSVRLSGRQPQRFKESSPIPTFLEWDAASICRIPGSLRAGRDSTKAALAFAQRLAESIRAETGEMPRLCTITEESEGATVLCLTVQLVEPLPHEEMRPPKYIFRRRFVCKESTASSPSAYKEQAVALPFPCPLSRQRVIMTAEFV